MGIEPSLRTLRKALITKKHRAGETRSRNILLWKANCSRTEQSQLRLNWSGRSLFRFHVHMVVFVPYLCRNEKHDRH